MDFHKNQGGKQQTARINLQDQDKITNCNEAFNKFMMMMIMCYPHKISGDYIMNINGLDRMN